MTKKWDKTQAQREGWDVFRTVRDGEYILEIQRLDDPASIPELGYDDPKFESDDDALAFVTERAKTSEYHAHALALIQ